MKSEERHPHHPDEHDRDEAVVDADDTGMVGGERSLVEEEIEQALKGDPPPKRP